MNIKLNENCSLEKPGIYFIKNTINNKMYIGSSTMKIYKRVQHHYSELKRDNHKNKHLQNAWNKYGEDNFEFIIFLNLEKKDCLFKEQELINLYGILNLYNINPLASGTPNLSKETIDKRNISINITRDICLNYKKEILCNNITIEDVPEKYKKWTLLFLDVNKNPNGTRGKTKETHDFSHLKGIKKRNTEKRINSRKLIAEEMRNKIPVYVYDKNKEFLGFWKNAHELELVSNNDDFNLISKMIFKNKIGRNGYKYHTLKVFNIQKSIRFGIPYKGLYFNNTPLHQVIDVE